MLSVEVNRNVAGHVVCEVVGEMDLAAAPKLRQALADAPSHSRVLIDLSGVSFVDSAGLGVLVGGIRRTRDRGGDAAVVCARPGLCRLLRSMGMDRLVAITEDLGDAIGCLGETALSLSGAV